MELLTKSDLGKARTEFLKSKTFSALTEAKNEAKFRNARTFEVTVFLSHKHDEVKELEDAIALLKSLGVSVYVDWLDDEMPKTTSGITATKIKKKIKENRKFIFLATEKAIASKWCNWELGYGDSIKYIDHIALLVVKDDYGSWTGSEYLQIYPVIGKKYTWFDGYYEVQFPDGKKIDLDKWLNS
ncbi:MAG: TIR domain-containing protein [Daejeonella sp.]